jgi:hypothetical protein
MAIAILLALLLAQPVQRALEVKVSEAPNGGCFVEADGKNFADPDAFKIFVKQARTRFDVASVKGQSPNKVDTCSARVALILWKAGFPDFNFAASPPSD